MRLAAPSAAVVAAFAVVLTLSACAAEEQIAAPTLTPVPTRTATATPVAPVQTAAPVEPAPPVEAAEPVPYVSPDCPPIIPLDETHVDRLSGYAVPVPFDHGPNIYSNGTFTVNDEGVPVAYTVAAGDTFNGIADRTCIWSGFVMMLNAVRRDSADIYPGDTINLDAYTITSVGDQNGVVYANEPWGYIPPQR